MSETTRIELQKALESIKNALKDKNIHHYQKARLIDAEHYITKILEYNF